MKRFFMLLIIMMMILPGAALADESSDRVQIQGDVVVGADEVIIGDAVAIMGNVTVDGKVMGDVVSIMGNVTVNGEVMGDVTAIGGRVTRSDSARIYGKVTQVGVGEGLKDIIRNVTKYGMHWGAGNRGITVFNMGFPFIFKIMHFLGIIALGALTIILFPNSIKATADEVDREPGRRLLIGILAMLLLPVVLLLMFITIIGIPLIPLALLLLAAAGFYGYLGISIFLGRKLNEQLHLKPGLFVEYFLGAALLWLVQMVPFVGAISGLLVFVLALGITTDTRFGTKIIV
ncbi:MAG TPA: polymer-forming cytoskeletal protein [Thermoanaerobacterales bacterium]|nr:polymer-forming cytoskeletal protein [Thermoanaerobacterales bacterium]